MNRKTLAELRAFVRDTVIPQVCCMRDAYEDDCRRSIEPTSDQTALVVITYKKTKTQPVQRVCVFVYWRESGSGNHWHYFIPSYEHVAGMWQFMLKMNAVEKANCISIERFDDE